MYDATKFSTSAMYPSFPPRLLLTLAINPINSIAKTYKRGEAKRHTRKIAEREVGNIWPTNLQRDAVLRERQLGGLLLRSVGLRGGQKRVQRFGRVQNGALRASNAFFHLPFVKYNRPKLMRTRLAQWRACRVRRQSYGDGALPRCILAGEATLSRAAARDVNEQS